MIRVLKLVAFFITLVFSVGIQASQEGAVPLGSFKIESPGLDQSGPISVSGIQGGNGVQSLTVNAFGKSFVLSASQLSELSVPFINGIQLSYEVGYKDFGGRTVYIQLSQGFTSGLVVRKYVAISESGSIKIVARSGAGA